MRPSLGTTVARRKLRAWCRWVYRIAGNHLRLLSAEVCKYAKMIVKHLDGTCGHWVCGTAHPFIERLNRGFSPVKRQAAAATSQIFTSCPTSPQAGAICLLPIEGGRNPPERRGPLNKKVAGPIWRHSGLTLSNSLS